MTQISNMHDSYSSIRPAGNVLADDIDAARTHAMTIRSVGSLAVLADDTIPTVDIAQRLPGEYPTPNEHADNLWVQESVAKYIHYLPRPNQLYQEGEFSGQEYASSSLDQLKIIESAVWWVDTRKMTSSTNKYAEKTPYFLIGEKILASTAEGGDAKVELLLASPDSSEEERQIIIATVSQVTKDASEEASFAVLQDPKTQQELAEHFVSAKSTPGERMHRLSGNNLRSIHPSRMRGAKPQRVPTEQLAQTEFMRELKNDVAKDGLRSDSLRSLYTPLDSLLIGNGLKTEISLTTDMLYEYDIPQHLAALSELLSGYPQEQCHNLPLMLTVLLNKLGDSSLQKLAVTKNGFRFESKTTPITGNN